MIDLDDLLQATNGRLLSARYARQFNDLAFDSRRLDRMEHASPQKHGPLFVAVKSDTGDGHDYIFEAARRGATGVLCQRAPGDLPPGITCILVEDTRQALLGWARFILLKYNPQVIAITGSSGKTIAKEAIAAVLSTRYTVFRNRGSYSGRYGLPIALGRLEPDHQIAVLELAADSLNEVRDLAELTRPAIGVITTINQAHVDTLGSVDAIEREKAKLLQALPADGAAVLNRDDPRVWRSRVKTCAPVTSFGIADQAPDLATLSTPGINAGYTAYDLRLSPKGLSFRIVAHRAGSRTARKGIPISLQLLGRHHVYAALAAIAVGEMYDVPLADIAKALAELPPLPGRLRAIAGRGGTTLLDDSYDAELACTLAALDAAAGHFERRRIVVLGGLRRAHLYRQAETRAVENRPHLREAYSQIGRRAAQVADILVLKGEQAQAMYQAALSAGLNRSQLYATFTNEEASRYVAQTLEPGDVVLVKGGRQERMEEIARRLMAHPEEAPGQLVRQEPAFRQVQLALPERPTWLEVDLEAIADNLRQIRHMVGPKVKILAVLKADGYGHGAVRIARTAANNGAQMLGVACLSEGVALRRAGISEPILILGYTPAWQAREAVLYNLTATVFDLDTAQAFSRVAGEVGHTARVHVKVDTGMGRLGLLPEDVLPFLQQVVPLPNLVLEGMFTHFTVADETDKTYTGQQLAQFKALLRRAQDAGLFIPIVHASNSAATLTVPGARFNMVRAGIALYGLAPSPETPIPEGFRTALSFKTRIAQVKTLPPGSFVSYGNTYRTEHEEQIAVIPVGYADGFRRAPAHWQYVLVKGQRAPVVGRVCMDQTMIDVTHIQDVRQGDPVVLIGKQGNESITVDQVADWLGTINYEVVSEILARVPRVS